MREEMDKNELREDVMLSQIASNLLNAIGTASWYQAEVIFDHHRSEIIGLYKPSQTCMPIDFLATGKLWQSLVEYQEINHINGNQLIFTLFKSGKYQLRVEPTLFNKNSIC